MASGKVIWRGKWVRGSVGGFGVGERAKYLSPALLVPGAGSGTGMGTSRLAEGAGERPARSRVLGEPLPDWLTKAAASWKFLRLPAW